HPDWPRWLEMLEHRASRLPSPQVRALLAVARCDAASGNLAPEQEMALRSCLEGLQAREARELCVEVLLTLVAGLPNHPSAADWLDDAMATAHETSSIPLILRVREQECDALGLMLDDPANAAIEEDRLKWIRQCGLLLYRMQPRASARRQG
ncbi:MAG: hypothetical protein VKP57_11480, partial [Candidatus Sericytochromatia bacterium]|nr:hypothetical protein [Candidatus Sericytochromatia bacterium]